MVMYKIFVACFAHCPRFLSKIFRCASRTASYNPLFSTLCTGLCQSHCSAIWWRFWPRRGKDLVLLSYIWQQCSICRFVLVFRNPALNPLCQGWSWCSMVYLVRERWIQGQNLAYRLQWMCFRECIMCCHDSHHAMLLTFCGLHAHWVSSVFFFWSGPGTHCTLKVWVLAGEASQLGWC